MKNFASSYPLNVASQYFLYFGGMGVLLPYFNLYCLHIGFNGFEIGVLSALRSITTIAFPILFGMMADRFNLRKPIYLTCTFSSAALWVFFLFTTDFTWMLVITVSYGIFYAPIISFLEAITMDTLGDEKKSYGTIRAWGSISFILVVVLMGQLIDRFSSRIILVSTLVIFTLQAVNSTRIPRSRSSRRNTGPLAPGFFMQRKILVFLFCAFLMLVSHGAYYGFFSIHLEHLGYSGTFIGITWALASIAEIVAMLKSKAIFKWFSLEKVLAASFAVAAIRWMLLYQITSPVLIVITQALHAITYGTFHMASILYIDQQSPDDAKNMGQAVNNAMTYGMGLMVGFFLNGYLYEHMASSSLFLISAFIAFTGGLLFAGNVVLEKKHPSEDTQI